MVGYLVLRVEEVPGGEAEVVGVSGGGGSTSLAGGERGLVVDLDCPWDLDGTTRLLGG